jgi:YihY family inner membrane protein
MRSIGYEERVTVHRRQAPAESRLAVLTSILAAIALVVSAWRARLTPAWHVRGDAHMVTRGPAPGPPDNLLGRVDATQRRIPGVSFAAAVLKKYSDDSGGRLVAHLTYSGFLSLFPLLLVMTTILGYVAAGRPDLQQRLLDSALVQFPIIGDQLRTNVTSLHGNALALAIGLVAAIWGGLGIAQAAQDILADVWMVPRRRRAGFVPRLGRAIGALFLLAGGLVTTAALSGVSAALRIGLAGRIGLILLSVAIDVVWFALAFRLLLPVRVGWSEVWPGALLAAIGWQILLLVGSVLVDRQLRGATQSYGFFGIVLGLLGWLALLSALFVLSAELNAVRAHRLSPRSLITPALTTEDRRALVGRARIEERAPG